MRRLQGAKGRVFAYLEALDAWKTGLGEITEEITPAVVPPIINALVRYTGRILTVALVICAGIAGLVACAWVNRTGPGSAYAISGRTLTVFDDQKRVKWRHELRDFVERRDPSSRPSVMFSDFDGDGRTERLFPYYRLDERGNLTPGSSAVLHFFSDKGRLEWAQPFGSGFRTPLGRHYPASLYTLNILGRLSKPRADGGVIIAGGYHGGTWVCELELCTAAGKKVGSYLHPGWLFAKAVEDLNDDWVEEILLGGANNGYGETGFSATLVVLDSRRVEGQGSISPGDDRQAVGIPTGTEAASILLRDFAKSLDENAFGAVHWISVGTGMVALRVLQERSDLPYANYRLDRQLRLTGVQPE